MLFLSQKIMLVSRISFVYSVDTTYRTTHEYFIPLFSMICCITIYFLIKYFGMQRCLFKVAGLHYYEMLNLLAFQSYFVLFVHFSLCSTQPFFYCIYVCLFSILIIMFIKLNEKQNAVRTTITTFSIIFLLFLFPFICFLLL